MLISFLSTLAVISFIEGTQVLAFLNNARNPRAIELSQYARILTRLCDAAVPFEIA